MSWDIRQGDALHHLRQLPDESIHCCITSPPYWGLRDYGTASWEGGDNPDCKHGRNTWDGPKQTVGVGGSKADRLNRETCMRCGASRTDQQLGMEATPEEYVVKIVEVFREVRRVLRSDGTCWLNLGDSYCSTDKWGGGKSGNAGKHTKAEDGTVPSWACRAKKATIPGLKPKDLVGIPWRVAFALQADGWWLRQDIIWSKPNPMPESVTDRCTKAHEYIFLLTKSANYSYDAEAIREKNSSPKQLAHNLKYAKPYAAYDDRASSTGQPGNVNNVGIHSRPGREGRNKRSVWTVAPKPFKEAHFATFPPELITPCVLAGCPAGGAVLDPFAGASTTGVVALQAGRNYLGIELNPEYVAMGQRRLEKTVLERKGELCLSK